MLRHKSYNFIIRNIKLSSILIVSILLGYSCSFQTKQKNDLNELQLNGKVKSISIVSYKAVKKFGEILKGEKESSNFTGFYFTENDINIIFNPDGNKIQEKKYGIGPSKYLFKYNKNGELVEKDTYTLSENLDTKEKCKYNSEGNLIEEDLYGGDGTLWHKYLYNYDNFQNLVEKCYYIANDPQQSKIFFRYDDDSNLIEEVNFTKDSIWSIKFNKYDKKSRLLETSDYQNLYVFRIINIGVEKNLSSFDSQERIYPLFKYSNKDSSINSVYLFSKTAYEYDEKGNLSIENRYKFDLSLNENYQYKYDNFGNLIESKNFDKKRNTTTLINYIYTYDRKNNWIKRIEFRNNEPKYIIERDIKYYGIIF